MRLSTRTHNVLSLAVVGSLALSASAFAAPAGDEYLPKVPEATGNQSGGGGGADADAPAQSSSAAGATDAVDEPTGGARAEGRNAKEEPTGKGEREASATPVVATETASEDDDSSGLFDPVVLLLVAGVIVAAVGMTLRHRAAGMEATATESGRSARDRGEAPNARPTPDGEIVAGGDKS
jgi:hypothetical protein